MTMTSPDDLSRKFTIVVVLALLLLLTDNSYHVDGLMPISRRAFRIIPNDNAASTTSFQSKLFTYPLSSSSRKSHTLNNNNTSSAVALHASTSSEEQESFSAPSSSIETTSSGTLSRIKKASLLTSIVLLSSLIVWKRHAIRIFLDYVSNEWLMKTLDGLNAAGPMGLLLYSFVFMIWTMTVGITTPVETAAGMAFGPVKGILLSGSGKLLGALMAFLLARYAFTTKVQETVQKYELLELMRESIHEKPLQVALLCRFSPLPELVKNAGMGVMPAVTKRCFVASLFLHGFSFTCLWTCMGAETARVLVRGYPPSKTLKLLLSCATWIGFSAPVLIGMWIKSLKDKQQQRRQQQKPASVK